MSSFMLLDVASVMGGRWEGTANIFVHTRRVTGNDTTGGQPSNSPLFFPLLLEIDFWNLFVVGL